MPIMPPKKNVPLSSPRKLPTWFMTPALKICLESKCKKEQGQLNKNKYVLEKKKSFTKYLDSRNGIRRRFENDKGRSGIENVKILKHGEQPQKKKFSVC